MIWNHLESKYNEYHLRYALKLAPKKLSVKNRQILKYNFSKIYVKLQ